MIGAFENEITQQLNTDELKAQKYFGELIDPKKFQFSQNELPMIYIDYIGNEPSDLIRKKHKFNLYVAHISFSKNEKTRTKKHLELYELLTEIDKRLSTNSFSNSEPIVIGKTQKIFDAAVASGYLTVFKEEFTVILKNEEETNE